VSASESAQTGKKPVRPTKDVMAMTTKNWTVTITLDEQGDDTNADAVLTFEDGSEFAGYGGSRRNPRDEADARIGDEIATARALSDLAHRLLETAASDIEAHTHHKVRSLAL
jgi:hypothetical protein